MTSLPPPPRAPAARPSVAAIAPGFLRLGIFTTWLRVRNGYPLDSAWGEPVYPKLGDETVERVKLLSRENAELRAELGAVKDRLVTLERIATDGSLRLSHQIDTLRSN